MNTEHLDEREDIGTIPRPGDLEVVAGLMGAQLLLLSQSSMPEIFLKHQLVGMTEALVESGMRVQ